MSLIDRNVLLSALTDRNYIDQSILDLIDAQPEVKPSVVVNISGGLLQGASATVPMDVYTLDFDDIGDKDTTIRLPSGSEAWLGQEGALVEPDFVQAVIDAPTLEDFDEGDDKEEEA